MGSETATNVVITEIYDEDTVFVRADPPPDEGTDNRWTVGDLAPWSIGTVTVVVRVLDPMCLGELVENEAIVRSDLGEARAKEITRTRDLARLFGGVAWDRHVRRVVDGSRFGCFDLLLPRRLNARGRLYATVAAPSMAQWSPYVFLRPRDELTPPYVWAGSADGSWVPGVSDLYYYEGALSRSLPDLDFRVCGIRSLRGQTLACGLWLLSQDLELKLLQDVEVRIW